MTTDQRSDNLPPASARLLRLIAEHDRGEGVQFEPAPRSRWKHPHTNTVFNGRTFYPLDRRGLVDVGNGHTSPVKITPAGREWIAANRRS